MWSLRATKVCFLISGVMSARQKMFVILGEFKKCLPEHIVVYLNEQKVVSLSQTAVLADEFALTHKSVFLSPV